MASVPAACDQHTLFPLYAIEVKCQVDCWAFRFAVTRCAAEKDVGQQSSPTTTTSSILSVLLCFLYRTISRPLFPLHNTIGDAVIVPFIVMPTMVTKEPQPSPTAHPPSDTHTHTHAPDLFSPEVDPYKTQ